MVTVFEKSVISRDQIFQVVVIDNEISTRSASMGEHPNFKTSSNMSLSPDYVEELSTSNRNTKTILHWFGIELRSPGGFWQKVQFITAISTITICSFFANQAINAAYEFFVPDRERINAKEVQKEIAERVVNIEMLSSSISGKLERGNELRSEELRGDTEKLLAEIRALQPEIYVAGNIASRAQFLFTETKKAEMQRQSFSTVSDFLLPSGQGATVCPEAYVFGMTSYGETAVSARLSGDGSSTGGVLEPGGALMIRKKDGGVVQVVYQGKYGEPHSARYGFSINCTN
ncbi:hypothetical protein G6L61_22880 [Agrobacterium fabrum]|nr:hypothetical protein [Agrobacterium fabrum]NSZ14616.1 hypothetical protein [Agrobacterium fabrum]